MLFIAKNRAHTSQKRFSVRHHPGQMKLAFGPIRKLNGRQYGLLGFVTKTAYFYQAILPTGIKQILHRFDTQFLPY